MNNFSSLRNAVASARDDVDDDVVSTLLCVVERIKIFAAYTNIAISRTKRKSIMNVAFRIP